MRRFLIASLLTLVAITACGTYDDFDDAELAMARSALGSNRGWSQADVTAIERELVGEKPSTYRLKLPVFRGSTIVGMREVGTLPVSEVNVIATRLNVAVRNDVAAGALKMCCGGTLCGAQGGGNGGNGGANGDDVLSVRLARVLNDLNGGEYQLLY